MHVRKNLYLVLDLTAQCSQNEILHAYNRAKTTYSRDSLAAYSLYDDNAKDGILREIEEAFMILGDPRKRRSYDIAMGYAEGEESEGATISDLLKDVPQQKTGPASPQKVYKKRLEISPKIQVDRNPEFEKEVQAATEVTGSFLRAVRLYRGYTEAQLASLCQLKSDHIVAIEEEKPLNLQHPVYLRGHLMLICEALEVPRAAELAKTYIERLQQEDKLARSKSL